MNIDIVKLEDIDVFLLDKFKAEEWPEADREHYGEHNLDFSKNFYTLVARNTADNKIIAYVSFFTELGVAQIDSLIVGRRFRRNGLAKKIINTVEAHVKSLGVHKIRLETGLDWKAKSLYEKLGYKTRAILLNYYANRDFVLMDKEI